jgi:cytosine/adenosine deaminase-related metal-dependent hydrolase
MVTYQADWVLPIVTAPLRRSSVTVNGGRVAAVGSTATAGTVIDLGRAAIVPGLVNAHTHLELSYLERRVPRSGSFDAWVRTLMALRRGHADPANAEILGAARRAIAAARASGTALVGDVSNTLATVSLLRDAGLAAQVFYELLGFNTPDAPGVVRRARARARETAGGQVRVHLAPHAPYSVSPALFRALRADLDEHQAAVSSVHLGESSGEVQLLRDGTGVVRAMLEQLGVWSNEWEAPGVSPVAYLADLGFLDRRVLVVHGVQLEQPDLERLVALGATIVSCPRSNQHVGAGSPPLEAFYRSGVRVALGTDSLASVADLNVFAELAEARRLAPRVPAAALLRSATLTGADALGFGGDFGSLEPGKRAALLAVRIPADVDDVEEYLVSGIETDAIAWLDSGVMPTP